jgi:hypothetical protein
LASSNAPNSYFDAYSTSPATKRLRDDGATFIGREMDFAAEQKVIVS